MTFLKSLLFIIYNVAIAYFIVYAIKFVLFRPRKPKLLFGKKMPLTPGLIPKYRNLVMQKIKLTLHDYLQACHNYSQNNMISDWEDEIYEKVWQRLASLEEIKYLPAFIKKKLRHSIALLVFEITRGFLRSFVPFLIQKLDVKHYITLLDEKISLEILEEYYNKYIYKYMLIVVLSFYFLIGIANMILYLIIPK